MFEPFLRAHTGEYYWSPAQGREDVCSVRYESAADAAAVAAEAVRRYSGPDIALRSAEAARSEFWNDPFVSASFQRRADRAFSPRALEQGCLFAPTLMTQAGAAEVAFDSDLVPIGILLNREKCRALGLHDAIGVDFRGLPL